MYDECGFLEPSVAPNMHESMINTVAQSPIYNDLNENNIIASFSIDDLPNDLTKNTLPDHEAASMVGLESLNQHMGMNGHTNLNLPSSVETTNWDHTLQQNGQNHQQVVDDYNGMQCPNIPFTNTQFTATPDLLNLMHLPRCTLTPPGFSASLRPSNYPFDICHELPGVPMGDTGLMLNTDVSMPLGYNPTQSHLLRDLFHSLPKNGIFSSEDERDAMVGLGGEIFQEMNGVPFENTLLERKRELGRGRGKANFATERQRREQLNEKYKALKSLFPNPTKSDRASIVGDAIEYIHELNRTVKELKLLLEKKKLGRRVKMEENSTADMESSTLGPTVDQENNINGTLRSSWLQRRSKESLVDVRIVDEEVNIRLTQKKRSNSLLYASKALDELQLELMHVSVGSIGDHHIFMFNTKIHEGASVYASAVAKKLLEAMEKLHFETIAAGF
ncbi:basic helix-loop-helix (bHLH) DNA-binding superfamily protein [Rhynchospora pubera]|uniref:Basic helix-loop-helix (BHLH) DNA-binding superfamily protein n=1 Tax=Rhynchospora pubera TaxID=906938 RepID=A0AAV8CVP9_9POAL|nr:basic helix-loop-helix (bHLH) DNA-binding superfamily protein [Rhynchospora pubera]KAJ4799968.1 basic helix-loop-helix (bHLH) DNA-binding superfamily protein [Rhynchospora pubera]